MADNTQLNTGSGGDIIATDDLGGGIKVQEIKRVYGLAGTLTKGTSLYHVVAAASTNAASIKGSPGQLASVHVFNNAAYPVYVKFYNKASSPTVGTDTVKLTVGVQAGLRADVTFKPTDFSTGIAIAMTKGITDADTTALLLSDCVVDVEYA